MTGVEEMSPSVLSLLGRVLTLREEPFAWVMREPTGLRLALAVVVLAGLSEALGQSVVLFANRVKPRRFVASLFLSAGLYTAGFVLWALSVWLVGTYVLDSQQSLRTVTKAVGLAYAPYLFSFFVLTPFFGDGVAVALSLWSLLAVLVAVQVTLSLTLSQALLCSALGWVLLQLLRRTVGRPVIWGVLWLRERIAGVPLITGREALQELLHEHDETRG